MEEYEPNYHYTNGIYTYFNKSYKGYSTAFDMNSAYLHALRQPLADWTTKTKASIMDVWNKKYDYYLFENDVHREIFYKEDIQRMSSAMVWASVKIYGFKSKLHYQQTAEELYRLRNFVDKEKYKFVANIAIGAMHKRSGRQNNTTIAASLYAWFAWKIDELVKSFTNAGYTVIMVTTDSIKIQGHYNFEDNLIEIGDGLGQFKVEYQGDAIYHSVGHYEENTIKWKGKPFYMRTGAKRCLFIENPEEELAIYEEYAVV